MPSPARLEISGVLDAAAAARAAAFLGQADSSSGPLVIDLSGCTGAESTSLHRLAQAVDGAEAAGMTVSVAGASPEISERLDGTRSFVRAYRRRRPDSGFRAQMIEMGEKVAYVMGILKGLGGFAAATLRATLAIRRNPRLLRMRMVLYYMEQSGVRAVPIIATLCWMLGTVLGFQAGYQLKTFAAEMFMPDLVAYSMTWEIAPLLAAVMVAGRSGSAFAAELGTMKVRQEIDALEVMGLDAWSYLVTPKMIALMVVMPLLVLLADFFGLLGGLLIGGWYLGMPAHVYMSRLEFVLIPMDIWWGMAKSIVYAVIIANVGCFMGMRVKGGAAEVGRATTSAVVTGIFLVIVADALISLIFMQIRPTVVV